jgi:hypothetical protein
MVKFDRCIGEVLVEWWTTGLGAKFDVFPGSNLRQGCHVARAAFELEIEYVV